VSTKKIWTNGCFDILHIGHIKMLQYARSLGDNLIVGIDSDRRVKELKGDSRPINNQDDRKELLLALSCVDNVFIFDSKEEMCSLLVEQNIKELVVGEEYRNKEVTGQEIVSRIHFFEKVKNFSTTSIIDKNET
jgi:rfaE bifunctional protein nucleotidyltransferase chain/domain